LNRLLLSLWRRPRRQLVFCALLDLAGVWWLAQLLQLQSSGVALPLFAALYLLFGWLFGSYTVLRWPWLQLRLVAARLLITLAATLTVVIGADWLFNLGPDVVFSHRRVQALLLSLLGVWSLLVRYGLRRCSRHWNREDWQLMASPRESLHVQREWSRHPQPLPLARPRPAVQPLKPSPSAVSGLVIGSLLALAPDQERELRRLRDQGIPITSVLQLAEDQLERLPPTLLPDPWLAMAEIPWADSFSVQRQLKRVADVLLAVVLLLLTLPLTLLAVLAIWIQDRGPVLYSQQRSGWMGRMFRLYKLRTMTVAPASAPALWTTPGDQRITPVGHLLRRLRIDELPQLLNVLTGDMSLIGPRPERPELEHDLEQQIPHYRKRHWMRPGLSGWAQVCAPYAASVEEAELKLSYDLYYLYRWTIWLDLLILFKTIKTVLKARGR